MIYETYIFEKSENKRIENERYILYVVIAVLFVLLLALFNIPGIGLATVATIAIGLIKIKTDDDKKKGLKRFGHLRAKIKISTDSIALRDNAIPIKNLKKLKIIAKDYYGKPKNIIGYSIGVDNTIRFELNGEIEELRFFIKSKKELELVLSLINEVEKNLNQ